MATITLTAVTDEIETVVQGLTPTLQSQHKFRPMHKDYWGSLEDFAEEAGSGAFRTYQIFQREEEAQPLHSPDERRTERIVELLVAYPPFPALGGGLKAYLDLVEQDRVQLRDAIFSSDNYPDGVDAQWLEDQDIEEGPDAWILRNVIRVHHIHPQTL